MTAACCVTTNPLFYHIYRTVDNMQNGTHRLSDELMRLRELGDAADDALIGMLNINKDNISVDVARDTHILVVPENADVHA